MAAGERVKPAWYFTAPVLSCHGEAAMNYEGTKHIKLEDRRTIEKMLKIKTPVAKIAEALGKCRKTIYNEGTAD